MFAFLISLIYLDVYTSMCILLFEFFVFRFWEVYGISLWLLDLSSHICSNQQFEIEMLCLWTSQKTWCAAPVDLKEREDVTVTSLNRDLAYKHTPKQRFPHHHQHPQNDWVASQISLPSKTVDAFALLSTHKYTYTKLKTHAHPLCDLWLAYLIYGSLRIWSPTVSVTHLPTKYRTRKKVLYTLRQP